MARILFTWELGGGAGHVLPYRPVIEELVRRGHQLTFSARQPDRVLELLAGIPLHVVPAPAIQMDKRRQLANPRTYAEVLWNVGFCDPHQLRQAVQQWHSLLQQFTPDVIVHDHSPTALLTSRDTSARRIHVGTGFTCPPNVTKMPDLRTWLPPDSRRLFVEEQVVRNVNWVAQQIGQAPVDSLAEFLYEVDKTVLATYPELDHAGPRQQADYWGTWTTGGETPPWPAGDGKRVFAYLQPGRFLPGLLRELARRRFPSLIVCPGIPNRVKTACRASTLCILERRLNLATVAEECDLAICHANHGTVAAMLCEGVPTVALPLTLEQGILARRVAGQNLGVVASVYRPEMFGTALDAIESMATSESTACFSHHHNELCTARGSARLVAEIEAMRPMSALVFESRCTNSDGLK